MAKGFGQVGLVNERPAAGVEDNGAGLHLGNAVPIARSGLGTRRSQVRVVLRLIDQLAHKQVDPFRQRDEVFGIRRVTADHDRTGGRLQAVGDRAIAHRRLGAIGKMRVLDGSNRQSIVLEHLHWRGFCGDVMTVKQLFRPDGSPFIGDADI